MQRQAWSLVHSWTTVHTVPASTPDPAQYLTLGVPHVPVGPFHALTLAKDEIWIAWTTSYSLLPFLKTLKTRNTLRSLKAAHKKQSPAAHIAPS
eukprot:scaffold9123_cov21-Tisochrysis_lutea.AAC.3